jgi:hypothetical protein
LKLFTISIGERDEWLFPKYIPIDHDPSLLSAPEKTWVRFEKGRDYDPVISRTD